MRFPFDSISFARAGHALRPQPSYPRAGTNSPLPVPHTPGDLAPISGSKQPASVLDPMRKTGDGGYSLRRRRALALPLARQRKRRGVMSRELHVHANGFELHGRRSPRDGRLAPAARQRVCACASSQCGRPLRRGHRRWLRGSCLAAGGEAACGAQSAPGGRFSRSLLAGRAPRARYSA